MRTILFAGFFAAIPIFAQVQVPGGPVAAPGAPVTAPTGISGFPAQPAPVINPAVPQAAPPPAVGRTFQTPPGFGGLPAVRPFGDPANRTPALGIPPIVAPGSAVAVTNPGLASPFSTNVGGFVGSSGVGPAIGAPVTEFAPPIANPAGDPVVVELPPGTVIRPVPTPGVAGGPLPPPAQRFPNAPSAGAAPGADRGTATSPNVVRPQR